MKKISLSNMWQKSDIYIFFSIFWISAIGLSLVSRISCHSSACHPQMSYYLCDICVQVVRRQDAQSSKLTVLFGLELQGCSLKVNGVLACSFRFMLSCFCSDKRTCLWFQDLIFCTLHLSTTLAYAWLGAVQTSAQHWTFCTYWVITFSTILNYATHWIFVLWWRCEGCPQSFSTTTGPQELKPVQLSEKF